MGEDCIMVSQNDEYIRQLISETRSGDRESAEHLAVIVRRKLYPFVLRTILNPDTAEDIVQETLLSVLLNLKRLRRNDNFWPWVYRIAICKTRDDLRKRRLNSAGKATLARDHNGKVRSEDGSVLDTQIHAEMLRQVSDEVDKLSYQNRDIIRLRYYEQLSYSQIASRTQVSARIARARSYRARKQLKECLV